MSQPYQPPAPYPQPVAPGSAEPLFQISLLRHTGALILWHQQTSRYTGTLAQCEQAYRGAQTHCLLAGWWSVASLFLFNWIALFTNVSAIRGVRRLAQDPEAMTRLQPALVHQQQAHIQRQQAYLQQRQGPQPGWYPDPSGQPVQRYWDGATWTAFTHPPAPR